MKIDTVWKKNGENEEQVPISTVKEGDFVVFRDGAMITLTVLLYLDRQV